MNRDNKKSPAVRRLLIVATLLAVCFLGLHELGRRAVWRPIRAPLGGDGIANAILSDDGTRLLWSSAEGTSVYVYDIADDLLLGNISSTDSVSVAPVGVMGKDLLTLRTRKEFGVFRTASRGMEKLLGISLTDPSGTGRKTSLERVELGTGKVLFQAEGMPLSAKNAPDEVGPFERGRTAFSPEGGKYLAWWRAAETGSATVTETIDLYSTEEGLRPVASRTVESGGGLAIRSNLLREIGNPIWGWNRTCYFPSFHLEGSLFALDAESNRTRASIPFATIRGAISAKIPDLQYGPESFARPRIETASGEAFLFWARDTERLYFFTFDENLEFVEKRSVETKDYLLAPGNWMERSGRLLVEDIRKDNLVALSPGDESPIRYPLPPEGDFGFKVIGEDPQGHLIGTDSETFLKAAPGEDEWVEFNPFSG